MPLDAEKRASCSHARSIWDMPRPENATEIVLTGGPCAGKTTIVSRLVNELSGQGVRVLTSPEVASMLFTGGVDDIRIIKVSEPGRYEQIEAQIMLLQGDMRRRYRELAAAFAPDPVCVIYDRAEMDAVSYLKPGRGDLILRHHGSSLPEVRNSYTTVIHLRTAARVSDRHYDLNNPARQEGARGALQADQRTMEAWLGHPDFWIVEAQQDFELKVDRALAIARRSLGIQGSVPARSFRLRSAPDPALVPDSPRIGLRLFRSGGHKALERREAGTVGFYLSRGSGPWREINADLFARLSEGVQEENWLRVPFVFSSRHFSLDHNPENKDWVLRTDVIEPGEMVALPDFLEIKKEISED